MKVALICGGPSLERGISLNSARSVMDHLQSDTIDILPFYLDSKKNAYRISRAQLYSNTPSDFDFKLSETAAPLRPSAFVRELRKADIVFPVMHGAYGEDGGIQAFLEKYRIPFVGSGSGACKRAFDKHESNRHIRESGFFSLPSALLRIYDRNNEANIKAFFREHRVRRAIVKPASGGSSIGVFSVSTPQDAAEKARMLFGKRMDTRLVVEPFAQGSEFTLIILQNRFGLPVALPPTEIETDYSKNQIFSFRKKYLPTRQVAWHCPPRFSDEVIERIQAQGEQIFSLFGLRDFARFDGWVLPSGGIWFCDFNTVSGMEQNSFLFQQGARVGMTHADTLRYILDSACRRYGMTAPSTDTHSSKRKRVAVLFGGNTSERQVSVMSGTNVWLKLRNSRRYEPQPYLLAGKDVWKLPYHLTLNHTVEEIADNCRNYANTTRRLELFETRARLHLGLAAKKDPRDFFDPQKISMDQLMRENKFIFNALHGGEGENGVLQELFEQHGIAYNGSGPEASRLCIDKAATAQKISEAQLGGVHSIPGASMSSDELLSLTRTSVKEKWTSMRRTLDAHTLVIKPQDDGCSSGIAHLYGADDLLAYARLVRSGAHHIPAGTFRNQAEIIEMPTNTPRHFRIERFVDTEPLRVKANRLKHRRTNGILEITVGVVEANGVLHALNPSITIAEGDVLSVEEKFQGGTGVNLTPPPSAIMSAIIVSKVKMKIESVAKRLGIRGYARIDAFLNYRTGELFVIEANTLPGLTPSTVLYHQALAETPPQYPLQLLESLIANKGY